MNQLIYVRPEVVADMTKGHFLPTILLTDAARQAIVDKKITLRKGQWLVDGRTGTRGQFVSRKGQTIRVRKATPGLAFADYQKKLAA